MEKQGRKSNGGLAKFFSSQESGILVILLVFIVIITMVNPTFISLANMTNVFRSAGFTLITALGMTFVIIVGGLDLSVGSVYCLSGTISAMALVNGVPVAPAILIGILVGVACGAFNGIIIVGMNIPPLITTLGMMYIARGIVYVLTMGVPVYPLPAEFKAVEQTKVFDVIPVVVLIAAVLAVIAHVILRHTPLGRAVYAVGGNPDAAKVSGINIKKTKMFAYMLIGGLAGLSGILMTSRLGSAQATSGTGFEMTVIAATIIGGTSNYGGVGTVAGTVLGAIFMEVLTNCLTLMRISVYWQNIVIGAILIGAVAIDTYRRMLQQRKAISNTK